MRRLFAALLLLSLALPSFANDSERWFHLRVQEENGKRTRVEVNLPYAVFAAAAPLIPDIEPHECEIQINEARLTAAELRDFVRAVEKSPEMQATTLPYEDGTIAAFRKGDVLVIQTSSAHFPDERSELQLPFRVAQALVQRDDDTLDLRAAALELMRIGDGQLLFAADDDTIVRLWVDRVPAGVRRKR